MVIVPRNVSADLESEAAVIGSMIHDSALVGDALQLLGPEHFYRTENAAIYTAMRDLYVEGEPVSVASVVGKLKTTPGVNIKSCETLFMGAFDAAVNPSDWQFFAAKVRDSALKREVIVGLAEALQSAEKSEVTGEDLLSTAEGLVFSVRRPGDTGGAVDAGLMIRGIYEDMLSDDVGEEGLYTGYHELDAMTSGLEGGQLIVVAGRPSMGKSSFALNIAHNIAYAGKRVGVWSMEMPAKSVSRFIASMGSGIPLSNFRRSARVPDERAKELLERIGGMLSDRVKIYDAPSLTPATLRAQAKRLQQRHGLDLVVVDYIQLMDSGGKQDNRQAEITFISRSLKKIARELDVPVIALSQLNRKVEQREDKRPMMSDLRESGAIEQDADTIMLCYRDTYYNPTTQNANDAEIIIGKQREGPTGTVRLRFNPECVQFTNLTTEDLRPVS